MDLTEPHEELVGPMGPNGEAKLVRGYIVSLTPVLLLEDSTYLGLYYDVSKRVRENVTACTQQEKSLMIARPLKAPGCRLVG